MNERIRELAEQAQGTRKHVPAVWQFYDYELEKFAELIIEECTLLMKREKETYASIHTDHCYSKAEAFEEAIDVIKHYFGVKE